MRWETLVLIYADLCIIISLKDPDIAEIIQFIRDAPDNFNQTDEGEKKHLGIDCVLLIIMEVLR